MTPEHTPPPPGTTPPSPRREPVLQPTAPAVLKRVSWGAIIAGAVVATVVHFMLTLLGIGIGFTAFSPATDGDSFQTFGIGQLVWIVIASILSLFAGGWVAGRLAGILRGLDGAIHGFATWGVATILSLFLLTSAVGAVFNTVTNAVGQGIQIAASGAGAAGGFAADQVGAELDRRGVTVDDVQAEARQILAEAGIDYDAAEGQVEEAGQELARGVGAAAMRPGQAGQELEAAINRAFARVQPTIDQADREALVNVLTERTDMTEQEARQTVMRWERQFEAAGDQIAGTARTVQQRAPHVVEDATDALGTAALWSFFALLLGALAAAGGGYIGSPERVPTVPGVRTPD